jgi:hypothetical protein
MTEVLKQQAQGTEAELDRGLQLRRLRKSRRAPAGFGRIGLQPRMEAVALGILQTCLLLAPTSFH